ncbi:MAG: hypothetical protein ACP5GD_03030 [Candidatus Micrarchaeia archaeon]
MSAYILREDNGISVYFEHSKSYLAVSGVIIGPNGSLPFSITYNGQEFKIIFGELSYTDKGRKGDLDGRKPYEAFTRLVKYADDIGRSKLESSATNVDSEIRFLYRHRLIEALLDIAKEPCAFKINRRI